MHKIARLILWTFLCVIILSVSLCVVTNATEYPDKNGLMPETTVSTGLPALYPTNVKSMTDEEFFRWATSRNKIEENNWFHKAALSPPRYKTVRVRVTKSKFHSSTSGTSEVTANGYITTPERTSGAVTHETREYTRRYNNPNYSWQGPLTIINPYVRPN